jgi:hypothetical protein
MTHNGQMAKTIKALPNEELVFMSVIPGHLQSS